VIDELAARVRADAVIHAGDFFFSTMGVSIASRTAGFGFTSRITICREPNGTES
jgi:hypothetical protein